MKGEKNKPLPWQASIGARIGSVGESLMLPDTVLNATEPSLPSMGFRRGFQFSRLDRARNGLMPSDDLNHAAAVLDHRAVV